MCGVDIRNRSYNFPPLKIGDLAIYSRLESESLRRMDGRHDQESRDSTALPTPEGKSLCHIHPTIRTCQEFGEPITEEFLDAT